MARMVLTQDDLLGNPSGPMLTQDEAAARGRVSETLVPKGTFVTYRRNPAKMSDLSAVPNAYNTGRVKVLTPENFVRDFPADGGTSYDAQNEVMMSYRTRAEAYKFVPYGDAKPVIGKPMWPAKQLFPQIPTMKKVVSVEHDIVPTSSRTSKRDSLVAPVDGDDSNRGFSPAKEMKGDLAMLSLAAADPTEADFYAYGSPDGGARNVDPHDLLTLVAWDDQTHDWQLSGLGAHKAGQMGAKIAAQAVALAQKGVFKSMSDADDWMDAQAEKIKAKRLAKLQSAVKVGIAQAKKIAAPQIEKLIAQSGVSDYLSDFRWNRSTRSFHWKRGAKTLSGYHWDEATRSFRWGLGDSEYPSYADNEDTSGWNTESNDTFAYIPNLGDIPGMVVSLDEDPAAAKAVTNAATNAVAQQVQSGQISTTDQVLKAIGTAAQAAAQIYTSKVVAAKPPSTAAKIASAVLPPDQPFYKQPLFWGGVGLLAIGGIFMVAKGGKGGGRRQTTRRYRRNTFPSFNRSRRRWKSRWA